MSDISKDDGYRPYLAKDLTWSSRKAMAEGVTDMVHNWVADHGYCPWFITLTFKDGIEGEQPTFTRAKRAALAFAHRCKAFSRSLWVFERGSLYGRCHIHLLTVPVRDDPGFAVSMLGAADVHKTMYGFVKMEPASQIAAVGGYCAKYMFKDYSAKDSAFVWDVVPEETPELPMLYNYADTTFAQDVGAPF